MVKFEDGFLAEADPGLGRDYRSAGVAAVACLVSVSKCCVPVIASIFDRH